MSKKKALELEVIFSTRDLSDIDQIIGGQQTSIKMLLNGVGIIVLAGILFALGTVSHTIAYFDIISVISKMDIFVIFSNLNALIIKYIVVNSLFNIF